MSYDFAVWEGAPPLSDVHAASEFERRKAAMMGAGSDQLPTEAIREFVTRLLHAYPDRDTPGIGESPWIDTPLISNAVGQTLYLRVYEYQAVAIRALVQSEAANHNLIAFDPQSSVLLPSATTVVRTAEFERPAADELRVHLQAVIGEALGASTGMVGVLEELATGYYVQWLVDDGVIVIEAQGDEKLPESLRLQSDDVIRMEALGFTRDQPNWRSDLTDGTASVGHAGRTLSQVLCGIREVPEGARMRFETFPLLAAH